MNLKPVGKRVVAKPVEAEAKSAAGILLPDSAKEKPQLAKVLAVGQDIKDIKAGDTIVYKKYGPTEFKQGDQEVLILDEEDVLAVVA